MRGAEHPSLLGTMLNSPGFCDQDTLLYLARRLDPVETQRHGEEERFIEVVEVPWPTSARWSRPESSSTRRR